MHLARHPRLRFAHLPTPLEPMDRLSEALDGPRIWVKRDDCTGLATGGNKTRKLEFLLAEAIGRGADTVLTQGAVQSNHARQTAAGAARLGLKCEILLEHRVPDADASYLESGNVMLDRLLGARIEHRPAGADMAAELEAAAERVCRAGGRPYAIPGGGSSPTGALGYVDAAMELVRQADARGLHIDHVVHATGSAGTQAGLLVGLEGTRSGIPVLGIGVRAPREAQEENVFALAERTAAHAGAPGCVRRDRVVANGDYVGPGYGIATPGMVEAVQLVARTEGILLDPVYSGKAMAGLVDLVRQGFFEKGQNVVFVHTGGAAGLFAYREALLGAKPA